MSLILSVGGERHEGFKSINLVRSMQQPAHSFMLELSDAWPGALSRKSIKAGQRCEISLDNQLLITGFIDELTLEYGGGKHSLKITGYSPAADLLAAHHKGRSFDGMSLLSIAQRLLKPYGLKVFVAPGVNVSQPFTLRRIDAGQSPLEFLMQLAKLRGVLFGSDERGNLLIYQSSNKRSAGQLKLGHNILSAVGTFSFKDVFSDYTLVGREKGWVQNPDGSDADVQARVNSELMSQRYRPFVERAEASINKAEAKKRIKTEQSRREARAQRMRYTVAGWRVSETGTLWQPNELVRIDDDYAGIHDSWLISEVVNILDKQGERSEIEVMPAAAFAPELKIDTELQWTVSK